MARSDMTRVLIWLAILLGSTPARAAMMSHFDLTGLTLESDLVVTAKRLKGTPSHYEIVRVLRGDAKIGHTLALDDSLYDVPAGSDPLVYVFLKAREDRELQIVQSGLRVISKGKVVRFEQWNNPGGWTAVPQGQDPSDQWRESPAIDQAEFDRELTAAFARADAFTAASVEKDPAKRRARLLALLPPAGDALAEGGFYTDALGRRVQTLLARAGDVEGALLAVRHDHAGIGFDRSAGNATELLALAADATRPVAVRTTALRVVRESSVAFGDAKSIHAVLAMYTDALPLVRANAVQVATQMLDWQSSDRAEQKRIDALRAEVKLATAKLGKTETSNIVLHALARFGVHFADRTDLPAFAATVVIRKAFLQVDVACLRNGTVAKPVRVTGTRDGAPWTPEGFNINVRCGDGSGGGVAKPLAPGVYALTVELAVNKKLVAVPLGGMFVDAAGEIALAPW